MVDRHFPEPAEERAVIDLLRQRGLEVSGHSRPGYLYVPPHLTGEAVHAFYGLMKHYSFRLFLRDVIRFRDELCEDRLTHFVDRDTAAAYLTELEKLGMVE